MKHRAPAFVFAPALTAGGAGATLQKGSGWGNQPEAAVLIS